MNNAWFFGCSFTAGTGYNFEEYNLISNDSELWDTSLYFTKYSKWKTNHQYEVWPYLLSKELELECKNRGSGGSSNDQILHNVIDNLINFKDGDYIIIGLTVPSRILIPNPDITLTGEKMTTSIIDSFVFSTNHTSKILQTFGKHNKLPSKKKEAIINYLYHIIYPQQNVLRDYYKERCVNLCKYLSTTGKTVVLWDNSIWKNYETIDEFTNGEVQDGHWSLKGHKEFTQDILKEILQNREKNFINLTNKFSTI